MEEYFPYPIPEFDAEPFWQACQRQELRMQRCTECGRWRWTPTPWCDACQSSQYVWERLSGRGTVHTWTVVTHPVHPAAVPRVPYVVVEVRLVEQEDLYLISNLVDVAPEDISMDMPVEVTFVDHPHGGKLPQFRPCRSEARAASCKELS
jgi:uncharacterized OB-fold protein